MVIAIVSEHKVGEMRGSKSLLWSALFAVAVAGQGQGWARPFASTPGQGQDMAAPMRDVAASSASSSSTSSADMSSTATSSKPTTVVVVAPRVATPEHPTAALSPQMRTWLFTNGHANPSTDCSGLFLDLFLVNGVASELTDPADLACLGTGSGLWAGRAEIQLTDYDYRLGMDALKAKDYAKAMKLFLIVYTQKGIPAGGLMVAKMHFYGLGVPKSTPQAIYWFQKVLDDARSQPDTPYVPRATPPYAEAAMDIGQIYLNGLGVEKNPALARRYYEQADRLGASPATYVLGLMWEQGVGGAKNVAKGRSYIKQAAENGDPDAEYDLGTAYFEGADGIPQDKKKGWTYLLDAAAQNNADALYSVGAIYDQGDEGIAPDHKKALTYYKGAALQNQPDAEDALGVAFYLGEDVPQNMVTARGLFKLAADQGNPDAMFNLAVMYANGEGGDQDMASAYALFVSAQRLGLEKAQPASKEIEPKLTAADRVKADQLLSGVAQ